jgi:DNA-binding Xre family transcriptional regulator
MDTQKSIRIAMAKKGINQKKLAEDLKMGQSSLSLLMKQDSCTGATMRKLAGYFGMKVSEFIALGEE